MAGVIPISLMVAQAAIVAVLLLFLFRQRGRWGLSPLYVAIGTFQYLQVVLAMSIYVEVVPGLVISPGSAVLFTSTLFAVLLVYIQEDAAEARSLVYGLVVANLALTIITSLFGLQLDDPSTRNFLDLPRDLFLKDLRVMGIGTLALVLDILLVIAAYEAAARWLPRSVWLRTFVAAVVVLLFDSLLFVTGCFLERPDYWQILISSIIGKTAAAALFSTALSIYFYWFRRLPPVKRSDSDRPDVFELLSYRQRYEQAKQQAAEDPLTGLFNRGFFEAMLSIETARAVRSGRPLTLMMVDLDRFKQVNDRHGHLAGDQVLQLVAQVLTESLRASDAACRFGGEEFAIVLPNTDSIAAERLANRIRSELTRRVAASDLPVRAEPLTATVGLATAPEEAQSATELVDLADRRLYAGKAAGRDRVVGADFAETQRISL